MEFKRGFKIKPKNIKQTGEVVFTDGTNEVFANEIVCRGYGYEYDKNLGVCYAFKYPQDNALQSKHESVSVKGSNNKSQSGTENSIITGTQNSTLGDNKNSLIIGSNNIIQNGFNNCLVTGTFATANNQGEFVIGGGTFLETADILDERLSTFQTSFILMNTVTVSTQSHSAIVQATGDIDYTDTSLDVTNYIQVINGSIQIFEIDVISVCIGGTSGTAGTFDQWKIEGAYKTGADGNRDSLTQSTTYKINNTDITPPVIADSPVAGGITVQCAGKTNINLEWYVNVKMITCKTAIDF